MHCSSSYCLSRIEHMVIAMLESRALPVEVGDCEVVELDRSWIVLTNNSRAIRYRTNCFGGNASWASGGSEMYSTSLIANSSPAKSMHLTKCSPFAAKQPMTVCTANTSFACPITVERKYDTCLKSTIATTSNLKPVTEW